MFGRQMTAGGLFAVFLLLVVPGAGFATPLSWFDQGKEAFRKGDYRNAVKAFEQARRAGVRRVALYYNLGVSYYRLGHYTEARKNFNIVARNKRMAALAHYNLGLVALRVNQHDLAKQHFTTVLRTSKDRKLRVLARRNLDNLDNEVGVWKGGVSGKFGYDSNITAAANGTPAGASTFVSFSAFTDNLLRGTKHNGLYVTGDLFLMDYQSQNEDQNAVRTGLKKTTRWGKYQAYYAGYYTRSNYRGSNYQGTLSFEVGARRSPGKGGSFRTRYRYESISSLNPAYDYLQGWRQKLRFERREYGPHTRLRYYYELEMNDRQDTATESYSPMRHTVRASYRAPLTGPWSWIGDIGYRISNYPLVTAPRRSDNRLRLSFTVSRKISKDLSFLTRLRYINNSSTVPGYTYSSNQIYAGISYYY